MPRVSIGMPVYNGEKYIREALDSILAQSFADFELIISDNASLDTTERICREYAAKDRRIRYYRNSTNLGAAKNFNRVFELSTGKYFKWAAHDDVCDRTFLAECIQVLDGDDSVVLCYPKPKMIDERGEHLQDYTKMRNVSSPKPHVRFHDLVLVHPMCFEVFGLVRSAILRGSRLIGNYTSSDRVLLAELSLYGRFFEIPEYLSFQRIHTQQSTKVYSGKHLRAAWFDPSMSGRITFPMWRILHEHWRSIIRAPLGWTDRTRCMVVIARWVGRSWKSLLYELLVAGKRFPSRSRNAPVLECAASEM